MRIVGPVAVAILLLAACSQTPPPSSLPIGSPTATAPSPSASQGAYRLDCGPLKRRRCEVLAADAAEHARSQYPDKRIVSIRFTTPTGSWELWFDDGSGLAADVD